MDPRVEQAQRLSWETAALKQKGDFVSAGAKFVEMARLHEARAYELFQAGNPDGWIDFYAAITAWGEAGGPMKAK